MRTKCISCGKQIEKERIELKLKYCLDCSSSSGQTVGFMVYSHKTAPQLVRIDSKNKEALRRATRANRRAR